MSIPSRFEFTGHTRAYEIIQEHLNAVKSHDAEKAFESLISLGIHPKDEESILTMKGKIVEAMLPDSVILPSGCDPGVFFVYNLTGYSEEEKRVIISEIKLGLSSRKPAEHMDPTAVFKMGSKRAQLELTARKIAHIIGFAKYVIPGVFFTIARPDMRCWGQDYPQEDLWNGFLKEFKPKDIQEKSHLVGVLEPFLKHHSVSHQKAKESFAGITTCSLALGLRDGREDNIIQGVIIDAEEYMPNRLDPRQVDSKKPIPTRRSFSEGAVAATHLPYLEKELAKEIMNRKDLDRIRNTISNWDIDEIIAEIGREKIIFFDRASEHCGSIEEDEVVLEDEGHCMVSINKEEDVFCEDGLYSPKEVGPSTPIFDERQLDACKTRLTRLVKVIVKDMKDKLTPLDLVRAVDGFYFQQIRLIESAQNETRKRSHSVNSGDLMSPRRTEHQSPFERDLVRFSPYLQAGRTPVDPGIMHFTTSGDVSVFCKSVIDFEAKKNFNKD